MNYNIPAEKISFSEDDITWIANGITETLRNGILTLGDYTTHLEASFSSLCQTTYSIAVNSGTSALEIILRAIGVEGREVIVPANTFFATAASVVHAGGIPVFVDIDETTLAVSLEELKTKLSSNTAAVVIVHIGGNISPDMGNILDVLDTASVPLVEDAAHAHGSMLNGHPSGSFGLAAAFSFYPTKMVTAGEGGIITTSSEELRDKARIYRDQGKDSFGTNTHSVLGYNWRMSEANAVICCRSLSNLLDAIDERKSIALCYNNLLSDTLVDPYIPNTGVSSNFYKYIARLPAGADRALLKKNLRTKYGISLSGEVYTLPLHHQPVFSNYWRRDLPVSERFSQNHICLPIYSGMTEKELRYVTDSLVKELLELNLANSQV